MHKRYVDADSDDSMSSDVPSVSDDPSEKKWKRKSEDNYIDSDFSDDELAYDSNNSDNKSEVVSEDESSFGVEKKKEDYVTYYNQTIGGIFIWTIETLLFALVILGIFIIVELIGLGSDRSLVLLRWSSVAIVSISGTMVIMNYFIAACYKQPGVFNRSFMMITQAYCGNISSITGIFSLIAIKSTYDEKWGLTFFQQKDSVTSTILIVFTAMHNIQWILSVVLTYSCTPFGQSNSSFLQIPVAFAFVCAFILANEIVNNQIIICGNNWIPLILTNAAIITSWVFYILSAVEFDPLHIFPPLQHSTADTDIRFDVYSLIHGFILLISLAIYVILPGTVITKDIEYVAYAIGVFIVITTLINTIDIYYVLSKILRSDNDLEQRIQAIQKSFAVSFLQAKEIQESIDSIKNHKNKKNKTKSKKSHDNSYMGLPVPLNAYNTSQQQQTAYQPYLPSMQNTLPVGYPLHDTQWPGSVSTWRHVNKQEQNKFNGSGTIINVQKDNVNGLLDHTELMQLKRHGDDIQTKSLRYRRPKVSINEFQNIPVTLRRTIN